MFGHCHSPLKFYQESIMQKIAETQRNYCSKILFYHFTHFYFVEKITGNSVLLPADLWSSVLFPIEF